MHKVIRGTIPNSLKLNSKKWTEELLEQVNLNQSFSQIPSQYVNKYKQDDVKEALKKMYKGLCCYCESSVGVQTYEHIEHLKPKSIFNDKCFEWKNLHLSCQVCNVSYKKDNWDYEYPILDPSKDDISLFLEINLDTGEICPINNNNRAKTTINHVGLNRKDLVGKRLRIINRLKRILSSVIEMDDSSYNEFCNEIKLLSEDLGYKLLFDTFISRL